VVAPEELLLPLLPGNGKNTSTAPSRIGDDPGIPRHPLRRRAEEVARARAEDFARALFVSAAAVALVTVGTTLLGTLVQRDVRSPVEEKVLSRESG
jgi:hypothetical protein